MHHKEKIEHAAVIDHLERAVEARKALLRAGPSNGNGPTGVTAVTRPIASSGPKIQKQALVQMRSMLSEVERGADGAGPLSESPEMADLRKAVHDSCALIREGLSRLTGEVSRLARASGSQNGSSNGADVSAAGSSPQRVIEEIGMKEPEFDPNQALRISLEAVPYFDGATAVQQALSDLPQASSVEVIEFEDTSASIEMALDTPVNVRQVMEQLREHTGRHYLVEHARPEEHKLRIRFIKHEEDWTQAGLRPELWLKA